MFSRKKNVFSNLWLLDYEKHILKAKAKSFQFMLLEYDNFFFFKVLMTEKTIIMIFVSSERAVYYFSVGIIFKRIISGRLFFMILFI